MRASISCSFIFSPAGAHTHGSTSRTLSSSVCLRPSIFGAKWRLTQGGQHDAQLGAHDGAVAVLVEDAETLDVVVVAALGLGVDLLQHGEESLEVDPLVGHVCQKGTNTQQPSPPPHLVRLRTPPQESRGGGGVLTVDAGAAQNLHHALVGGVLAQSAHDVGHLVEAHLAVTDSVEEAEGLLEL